MLHVHALAMVLQVPRQPVRRAEPFIVENRVVVGHVFLLLECGWSLSLGTMKYVICM